MFVTILRNPSGTVAILERVVSGRVVNKRPNVWIAPLVLAALISATFGVPAEAAAQRKSPTKRSTVAAPKSSRTYGSRPSRSRRARLARARAAAMARELAEAVIPRYKVDAAGDLVPDLKAAAAIVYSLDADEVLWEERSQDQRSIASITKVMTAVVFLENNPDLSERVGMARSDTFRASTTYLRTNDQVTAHDLVHLLLIASDNAAARALARISPWGPDGFIDRMNQKAAELGLAQTHYADSSGLLSDNVSSAYDMARLIAYASADARIASIMQMSSHTVLTPRRAISVRNTNHLLGRDDLNVLAAKTGFISRSGYCLATVLRLPETDQEVAVVVLGARSNAGRFLETRNLFNWFAAKASTIFATSTPSPSQQQQ